MTNLAGTGSLIRLALRRDRVRLPVWLGALLLGLLATASSYESLYPTQAAREAIRFSFAANPAFRALLGPPFDLTSTGGFTVWRIGGIVALLLGLMNVLLVSRHTRGEEESGRAEMVRAARVGRYAPLAAALLVAGLADVLFALLVSVSFVGLELPIGGSIAAGLALGLAGWTFAGITGVTAQVAETARGASGLAGVVLGLAYLLRAVGDTSDNWVTWLSPIGWFQQTRAFADERWWVLLLPLALTVAFVGLAVFLVRRRDLGAGLISVRAGRATASANLSGPLGLAWRLHRGVLLGWTLGFLAFGGVVGAVTKDVGSVLDESPELADILQQLGGSEDLADAYIAAVLGLAALAAAGYVIQATLRIRAEETALRAEQVLAGAVSRWRWAVSHVLIAAVGTVVVLAAAGLGMGIVYGLQIDDPSGQVPRLLQAVLVQAPAALVIGGLTMALLGFAPRVVAISWAVLAGCLLVGEIGELLRLPQWLRDLSPFVHTPSVPVVEPTATPLVVLTAVAGSLALLGLVGLRRRDIG